MNIRKAFAGLVAVAGLTVFAAGSAMATTETLGSLINTTNQNVVLTSGTDVSLLTNVYYNGSAYTYQYDLTNVNDASGIFTFGPTVSNAKDFGTSGLQFYFGGAPSGGTVTVDGLVGNDSTNVGAGNAITGDSGNLSAYGQGNRIEYLYDDKGGLGDGDSTYGEFGDYFYITSNTAPGLFDINVTDNGSADFPGQVPGTPEPSSVAGLGIGLVALLCMGALAVRRRSTMAS